MWNRRRLLACLLLGSSSLWAKKKKKKAAKDENLGLLTGTVFQSSGFSLPGAKVTATAEDDPKVKFETISDGRGEFSFRAPAGAEPGSARRYKVRAEAKGFQPGEKSADVYLAQRTNMNLLLSPEKAQ
ncbi:MAG: hypothetical protein GC160_10565 [Acidobacteria bacterium]|nr:hypothetical protein [Acidobacteriota bacterium]